MVISNYSQNTILVELPPESDIRPELDKLMETLNSNPNIDVVIDFASVDIMTSMTLSGFLKVREIVGKAGRRLIFVNVSSITRDIFTVTCFDGIFEFANDVQQAVDSLANVQCEKVTN